MLSPAQKIGVIADELMKLNPNINWRDALLNSVLTHLDREEREKAVEYKDVKNLRTNTDIILTLKDGDKELVLRIERDADIYTWARNIDLLLQWLTFHKDTISLVLDPEETND